MKMHQDPQRKEVADALRDVALSIRSLGQDAAASRLLDRADRLEQGRLQINFIGDSGRGKTTLINVLLHENGLLPSGVTLVNTPPAETRERPLSLANADAIVMLLGHSPLLTQTDIEEIRTQLHSVETAKVEHLFFVINDFGILSAEDKKQVLEEIAPRRLSSLFGEDDDLFARRVFFINVKAALEARRAGLEGEALEKTGLPPFEQALQDMFTTEEGTRIAMQAVMNRQLVPAIREARDQIRNQKAALDAKLDTLHAERHDQEQLIDTLTSKRRRIQNDFEAFTRDISQKIVARSHTYIAERLKAWNGTWEKEINQINLSIGRMVSTFFSKHKKEELAKEVASVCEKYFKETLTTLQEELAENLQSELEAFTAEFEKEMTDLAPNLGGISPQTPKIPSDAGMLNSKQILSAFKNENLELTFGRMTILGIIPLTVFLVVRQLRDTRAGLLTLSIVILFEAFFIFRFNSKAVSETLKNQLSKVLTDAFTEYTAKLEENANYILDTQLKLFSAELLEALDTKIEAAKVGVDETAGSWQAELAAIDAEKTEFDTIQARIDEAFDAISQRTYGRVFTPEEQHEWIGADA